MLKLSKINSLIMRYHFSSECYYKLLNLSTEASAETIKENYLEMAKRHHPDLK